MAAELMRPQSGITPFNRSSSGSKLVDDDIDDGLFGGCPSCHLLESRCHDVTFACIVTLLSHVRLAALPSTQSSPGTSEHPSIPSAPGTPGTPGCISPTEVSSSFVRQFCPDILPPLTPRHRSFASPVLSLNLHLKPG